ncbi:MAG: beta-aspartyl-peptidase [Candidatus Aminicenantes bacterium]|nr:beta-aspartyl-peptidase [Candidatus Aminicenantes bacterium]
MITVIRRGTVFAPQPLGVKDIWIFGERIGSIVEPGAVNVEGVSVKTIDAEGFTVAPGIIDPHVHILGGGGEGGPATRAPEIRVEDIIRSGVTTVIGCLGTDGVTRHASSLLAKARALDIEGVTAYIFIGSYEVPVRTLTGSVRSDLALIDKIIGAGEVAVSDHRSSQPTFEEIARLAAECRVGGLLGGKAGVLHLHLGSGARKLEMLFRLTAETEIPPTQVIPTHANRNRALLEEGLRWIQGGGWADLTAGTEPEKESDEDVSVETALRLARERGVPLERFTVSSDSNGSLPVFDSRGELTGLTVASQDALLSTFRSLVRRNILSLEETVRLFAFNPARFYKLERKGELAPGKDADLILLDKDLALKGVIARGAEMMSGARLLVRGTFRPA